MDLPINTDDVLDGKYRVEEIIGEGGMGVVVSARHLELDTPVAIKILRPHAEAVWRRRFVREARAASQLDHENVAKVFDIGRLEDGTPFMVMELLTGCDLSDVLYNDGPLEISTAVEYARQACAALDAAHQRGIVHRDVKPANLFLTHADDGRPCVKLLDFGISKVAVSAEHNRELTSTGSFLGSPQFMSPEQLASCRDVDARSDVWSLGATLFELLTGDAAFAGDTIAELYSAILRDGPRSLRDHRRDAPAALETIIGRCLDKDATRRVQSARELGELLDAVDLDVREPPATASHGAPKDSLPPSYRPQASTDIIVDDIEPADMTPGPTVRPTSYSTPPAARRVRSGALLGAGLLGAMVTVAVAAIVNTNMTTPLKLESAGALRLVVATPHVEATPDVAPVASAEAAPFVESGMLGEAQREHLGALVTEATQDLERGEHTKVVEQTQGVLLELNAAGISPNKAVSSLGARSQLLLGHVQAARVHAMLAAAPSAHTKAWTNQLDVELGHARVSYEKVGSWGVRSFYRCGLVEMATLDARAAETVRALAHGGDLPWFVARSRRLARRAKTSLRHALQVKAETMLCVQAARDALHELEH